MDREEFNIEIKGLARLVSKEKITHEAREHGVSYRSSDSNMATLTIFQHGIKYEYLVAVSDVIKESHEGLTVVSFWGGHE